MTPEHGETFEEEPRSPDSNGTDSEAGLSLAVQAELDRSAAELADELVARAPGMLAEHKRLNRGFERRLRKYWGEALDLFYMIAVCDEEVGGDFNRTHGPVAVDRQDHLFVALTGIHARACRVAFEVHHLLCGGFPMGALARCRTLHELAVTAIVLADFGGQDGHPDLPERFLLHQAVSSWKDAQTFQANWEALGVEPFSSEVMAEMKETHDALVERFGRPFKEQYGWAADLLPNPRPTFRDVERLAKVSHLRGYYSWASHEVHSDAKGWALNTFERGGVSYLSTNRSNDGLADPGQMALISLHQTTVSLLLSVEPPDVEDLRILKAMDRLLDQALATFIRGDNAVRDAEDRFQARQARKKASRREDD